MVSSHLLCAYLLVLWIQLEPYSPGAHPGNPSTHWTDFFHILIYRSFIWLCSFAHHSILCMFAHPSILCSFAHPSILYRFAHPSIPTLQFFTSEHTWSIPRRTCRRRPQPAVAPPSAGWWAGPCALRLAAPCFPVLGTYCNEEGIVVKVMCVACV